MIAPERRYDRIDPAHEKHVVFKKNKQPHVTDNRGDKGGLALPLNLARLGNDLAAHIVPCRGGEHKHHEPWHQPPIKNIAPNGNEGVFRIEAFPLERQRVVD